MSELISKRITLNSLLAITTLSVPLLYLIGYFYHEGYLTGFHVSSEFFTLDTFGYLMNAFFVVLIVVSKLLVFSTKYLLYFTVIGVFAFLFALAAIVSSEKNSKLNQWKEKVRNHRNAKYLYIPILFGFIVGYIQYFLIAVLGIVLLVPMGAYELGKNEAGKAINNFDRSKCNVELMNPNQYCIKIKHGEDSYQGLLIAASDSMIAIYNGKDTLLIPKTDEVIHIEGATTGNTSKVK